MANDQILVTEIDQRMQECDGVATAGDPDEVAITWRERASEIFGFDQQAWPWRLHEANVQRSTRLRKAAAWQAFNVQRSMQNQFASGGAQAASL